MKKKYFFSGRIAWVLSNNYLCSCGFIRKPKKLLVSRAVFLGIPAYVPSMTNKQYSEYCKLLLANPRCLESWGTINDLFEGKKIRVKGVKQNA